MVECSVGPHFDGSLKCRASVPWVPVPVLPGSFRRASSRCWSLLSGLVLRRITEER